MLNQIHILQVGRPWQHVISTKELSLDVLYMRLCVISGVPLQKRNCLRLRNMTDLVFDIKISLNDDEIVLYSHLLPLAHLKP